MAQLSEIEIITGIFSIIQSAIYIALAILLIKKYFRYREKNLLFMGICMITTSQPWWSTIVSLIRNLSGQDSVDIATNTLIGLSLSGLAIFTWLFVMINLIWSKRKKILITLSAIFSIIYEIFILYAIFVAPHSYARRTGPLDVIYLSWLAILIMISILLVLITGIFFFRETLKSLEPEIRLKGKFVLVYSVLYVSIVFIDAFFFLSVIPLLITRVLLVLIAFLIYNAFALPNWVKNIFIKNS